MTILVTMLFSIMSYFVDHGSILTAAIVTIYCFYMNATAFESDPSDCNSLADEQSTLWLVVGLIVASVSVVWSAYSLTDAQAGLVMENGVDDEKLLELDSKVNDNNDNNARSGNDENKKQSPSALAMTSSGASTQNIIEEQREVKDAKLKAMSKYSVRFFLVMSSCAIYLAMLLTAWSSPDEADETGGDVGNAYNLSEESYWIMLSSMWVTELLYLWTLMAPCLFPDREFDS